ncbi:MAG TPA: phosphate signaling complex protein PhoU [Candidatus Hydrogenedentes bacterium]|nr:phosphate signaling complex protein PhoU [Candidatus Hydrogenedentota bacterium]HOS03462.1 phosphate signaling complex protein PhoU [Candidatus Hydrogenedentota bacterium]
MSSHLQREIDNLKKNILSLSALVEGTLQRSLKALRDLDPALAQAVIEADSEIDYREVEIEEECLKIIALYQPVANDLRFIIAVLKINAELERIGDAAVNIAEQASFLGREERTTDAFDFPSMAEKAQWMLRSSLDALVNRDAVLAHKVLLADDEVDQMNRDIFARVQESIRRHPAQLERLVHTLGISRHIERIGDHATNIAEDVLYMINGDIVRHRNREFEKEK